jgi:hypothetical protein
MKNHLLHYLTASLLLGLFLATMGLAQQDSIYEKCRSQNKRPAPWCYQEEVKATGNPDLCDNILKYWPTANGVHGQCFYELAIQTKNCDLCKRIKNAAIRKMCTLDVCKKKSSTTKRGKK